MIVILILKIINFEFRGIIHLSAPLQLHLRLTLIFSISQPIILHLFVYENVCRINKSVMKGDGPWIVSLPLEYLY